MTSSRPDRTAETAAPHVEDEIELDRAATLRLLVIMTRTLRAILEPVRQQLKRWDLSPTEFGVLEVLYHKGPLPLSTLAEQILITGASTTYTVKGLEERGLMRRRPSSDDQRFVFGELTEAGRVLMAEVFPEHAELLRRSMHGLTRLEKQQAAEFLKRLGQAVQLAPPAATLPRR